MRAYERFLDYVKIHTTSDDSTGQHPSTARQFDLAHLLVKQLKELGLADARVDEQCYVYATLPATPGCEDKPALGFISHMDTAPDASGENVKPQLHPDYDGGVIQLNDEVKLDPVLFPFMPALKGQMLITTDGTTLLGGDDKAGVAEIMTAIEHIQNEKLPHGKLCIGFTPDEEIGEGADGFDVPGFGAQYAFTMDGGPVGEIEYQNFNAAGAMVICHGFSVHPGSAKNVMINAQNVAMEFHSMLPAADRPEHTDGTDGFFHLTSMVGDVTEAKLGYIVRDHDREKFEERKTMLRRITGYLNQKYGEGTVELGLKDSYYNMEEKILPHFHLIENAIKAHKAIGVEPVIQPIRGGTDGARLSFEGLPCPNLGTGTYTMHGVCEFVSADQMDKCTQVILNLVAQYAE